MLGRYGQPRVGRLARRVALGQHVGLLYDLARVAQQLGAVVGERHAPVAAHEYAYAQLGFEVFDGGGQVRLRRVEVLRCGVDGAVLGYGDEVAQLLERHRAPSFGGIPLL